MQKLFKIPLMFLMLASGVGLFLRYMLIFPVKGVNFSYVVHGHSHVMFLGWIFNVLFLGFVSQFTEGKGFQVLFWILQSLVVGMFVSFPLQGYGLFSILFTTLHTLIAFVFIVRFFRSTKGKRSLAVWLARVALLLFVLSSLGPFYLGYLMSAGMGHSDLYRFSIYFYLHFQYNGFFFFGILSLLANVVHAKMSMEELRKFRSGAILFFCACFPTYCLSVLWAKPGGVFNLLGLAGAVAQLIAMLIMIRPILRFWNDHQSSIHPVVRVLWKVAGWALITKLMLQLISADPRVAAIANEYRSVVIAYLHLVLVGIVTLFLIGWLQYQKILAERPLLAARIFLTGFIVSEMVLVSFPWGGIPGASYRSLNGIIFFASVLMFFGVLLFFKACFQSTATPVHHDH